MPLDHYVTLGRSGLRVSPFCLGTMTFGEDWGWGSDVETSKRVIDTYLDRGGNFLDTANMYTKGHSETIIGEHLEKAGKRDRVVIATKCTGNLFPGDPNGGGSGRVALMNAVHESLRRLRTDRIDLLWAHFLDRNTPIDETLRAVEDLIRQGKVRYFGLSDHPAWVCAQAQYESRLAGLNPIIALQIEYSLLERTVEAELIPMAMELGMGVTPWSPLKGGVLTGKYTRENRPSEGRAETMHKDISEQAYNVIDGLIEVGKEIGATPAQVALAWCRDRPGVTSTIIGARTLEQLEANLGALDVELPPGAVEKLDELSRVRMPFPYDFVHRVQQMIQGGTTVNGRATELADLLPQSDDERW